MRLCDRRKKLSMNYALKLKNCPNYPSYSAAVFLNHRTQNLLKIRLAPPLGLRILPLFEDSKIDSNVVGDITVSDIPP